MNEPVLARVQELDSLILSINYVFQKLTKKAVFLLPLVNLYKSLLRVASVPGVRRGLNHDDQPSIG